MQLRNFISKSKHIWGYLGVLVVLALVGAVCPLVYGLNDDTMISSILSGAYAGTPNGHTVYLSYPLSGLLSLLYRIDHRVAWFPLFFLLLLAGCVYVVLWSVGRLSKGKVSRWLALLLSAVVLVTLLFPHYVVLHYTIMAAVFGATALFVFLANTEKSAQNMSLVLLLLCYMVRSQVFYLSLPFLFVAVLWKVLGEFRGEKLGDRVRNCKDSLKRNAVFLEKLCVGFLALLAINGVMYGGADWKEYTEYNDARTAVYDYAGLLPYEGYRDIYEGLGITEEQYHVLDQYGTVLDESLDAEKLNWLAENTMEENMRGVSKAAVFKEKAREYYYRTIHDNDRPYSYMVLVLYGAVLVACVLYKRWLKAALTLCLGGGRSVIWLYLMMKGRYPERVTVSLYLLEGFLLAGMLLSMVCAEHGKVKMVRAGKKAEQAGRGTKPVGEIVLCAVLALATAVLVPGMAAQVQKGTALARYQQGIQQEWEQLENYMQEHPEEFYYLDVFSVVSVTGMQYGSNEYENYTLLGGWMTESPLLAKKQEKAGHENALKALAEGAVLLVVDEKRSDEWIEAYAKSVGKEVEFMLQEQVGRFGIYRAGTSAAEASGTD